MTLAPEDVQHLLDAMPDAVLIVRRNGTIAVASARAKHIFGSDLVGRSVDDLVPATIRPTHPQRVASFFAEPRARAMADGRVRAVNKDGKEFPVEISLSPLLRDGEMYAIAVARDVTDRAQREARIRRLEEQLQQAQKMEAIGRLAGGVAHDFNNLLSVILTYSSLLLEDLRANDPIRGEIQEILAAGERARDLTMQLLAFSRHQVLEARSVSLADIVANMENMLRRLLGEHIELSIPRGTYVGKIHADPGQIEQVILNLAINARDAMPDGGKVMIEVTNIQLGEDYAAQHHGVTPGAYVMLAVSDTGIGMDEATREHIFEPFFTTKGHAGTGLGLSTVFGIVKQSGGHIWVYSEPRKGTSFKVYFPRNDQPIEGVAGPPPSRMRGNETILLVEDEERVRHGVHAILRRYGYHVLEAANAGDALLVCEQFEGKIHLLLTDVVMPHLSGKELAERLSSRRPEMKVLFMSGYTDNSIVHHGVLDAGVAFLQKPIEPAALLRKLRAILSPVSGPPSSPSVTSSGDGASR